MKTNKLNMIEHQIFNVPFIEYEKSQFVGKMRTLNVFCLYQILPVHVHHASAWGEVVLSEL